MGFTFIFGSKGEGINVAVTCYVEVNFVIEVEFLFHVLAQVVKVGEQFFLHLEAVPLHAAAPVGIAARRGGLAQHVFNYFALQSVIYLFAKLFL